MISSSTLGESATRMGFGVANVRYGAANLDPRVAGVLRVVRFLPFVTEHAEAGEV